MKSKIENDALEYPDFNEAFFYSTFCLFLNQIKTFHVHKFAL